MKNCPHKLKHTERLFITKDDGVLQPMEFVIVTYCADCGKTLNKVKIIWNSNAPNVKKYWIEICEKS